MKNQYFGDRNDMFKYDLALTLVTEVAPLVRFTFVPMLTPDDGRSDGNLTDYPTLGSHRPHLHRFLMECVANPSRRKVASLREYMRTYEPGVAYCPYMDEEFLAAANRNAYFGSIAPEALRASVIFVDPDNGFEVPSTRRGNAEKYLRYSELANLYRAMDDTSVLLAYQHWAYVKRTEAFATVTERTESALPEGLPPVCISSGSIGIFAFAKTDKLLVEVRKSLDDYALRTGFRVYSAQG